MREMGFLFCLNLERLRVPQDICVKLLEFTYTVMLYYSLSYAIFFWGS